MKLIKISDRMNIVHYININHIVRIQIQKDDSITIWDVNNFGINTYMGYSDFLKALSDHS